jgi:phage-related protein
MAPSYEAGTAFLQILPSARGFGARLRRELAGVDVGHTVPLDVDVDDGWQRTLRAAIRALPSLVLGADASSADRELAAIRERMQRLSQMQIGLDISGEQARAEIQAIEQDLARLSASAPQLSVRVDAAAAEASLERVQHEARRLDGRRLNLQVAVDAAAAVLSLTGIALLANKLVNRDYRFGISADTAGAVLRIAALSTLVFGLGGATGAILGLGGAIAGLGAAGAVAAAGVIPAVLGFRGVFDAVKALSAQQETAAVDAQAAAQKQSAAAAAVASAQSRVGTATRAAGRARADASKQVAEADARLRRETADLERAQAELTRAWEAGRRSLQDLQDQVDGNALDQRQAAFDLADARKALQEARDTGDADQIARAQLAVDKQIESMDQLSKRTERATADNAAAQAAGIAGSEQVLAATDRIASAERGVADARSALDQARIDGAERIADADLQVIEAQRALTQALAQTGDTGSSAAQKVQQAFADLSPEAASFARYIFGLKPLLDELSGTAATAFFPPLRDGMDSLITRAPLINGVVGQLAGAMGTALGSVLTQLSSPYWTSFFQLLGNAGVTLIPALFDSLLTLAGAGTEVLRVLLPLAPAGLALLDQFSALLVILAPFIAQFLGGLIPAASALLTALAPLGTVLAALTPILAVLGEAFATVLLAVLQALAPILVALTPLIEEFATQWAVGLVSAITTATPLLVTLAEFLSQNADTVVWLVGVVGGLVASLQPLMWILGLIVTALARWIIIGAIGAALSGFGAAGATVAAIITRLLSPISLIRLALPYIGQALAFVGRMILGALGPMGILLTVLGFLYSSNEQFRNAVNQVFAVLAQLVGLLIASVMPAFEQIMAAIAPLIPLLIGALMPVLNTLIGVFLDLVSTVLPPLIAFVVGQLIPVVTTLAHIFATVLVWIITNVVVPAIQMLAWVITNVVAPVILWLYENVVKPAFEQIGAFISWVWTNIIKPAFDFLVFVLTRIVGPAIEWLWRNIVEPAFGAIGVIISTVWENVIRPAFDAIGGALGWLGRGFDDTVRMIGDIWNGLRNLLAVPINFLIGTVFNNGIRKAWNLVADLLPGVDPIGELPLIPEFRRGGVFEGVRPGYTPGRDNALIAVGGGESVMRPEWTREVGGRSYVDAANYAARTGGRQGVRDFLTDTAGATGRDVGQVRQRLMGRFPLDNGVNVGLPAFAYGGVVPHVAAAGQEIERLFGRMPGGIGGVGARANASDHPRGLALDFMTMADTGLGNRVTAHMLTNARRLMVKYIIWQQRINSGEGWRGMEDRGSPTANHMDHPHVSFLKGNLGGASKDFSDTGGGFFDFLGDQIRGFFTDLTNPPIDALRRTFPTPPAFMAIPAEAATLLRDKALDFMLGQGEQTGPANEPPGSGVLRWTPVVSQALAMLGQPLAYIPTTLRRMAQESGGNPRAINNWDVNARRGTPSKGLMQVIDPTFRTHRDGRAPNDIWDPLANVLASMRYALSRYGSLPRAYDRRGGYDSGGVGKGIGWMWKGTGLDERVLPPQETQAYPTLTVLARELEADRLRPPAGPTDQQLAAALRNRMPASAGTRTGRGLHIENATFVDPVDVDVLGQRLEFATRGESL